jgi:hypothetical protein
VNFYVYLHDFLSPISSSFFNDTYIFILVSVFFLIINGQWMSMYILLVLVSDCFRTLLFFVLSC